MTDVKLVLHCDSAVHSETKCSDKALNSVLFDFNPTTNPKVARIKALCAGVIQEMLDIQAGGTDAQRRTAAIAITQMELTQMAAVKALFAK